MLMDLLVNFVLIGVQCTAVAAVIWVLSRIPFVCSTAKRFGQWFDSLNDKMDEAMGYYETWRQ